MANIFRFDSRYFSASLLLLLVLIAIAIWVNDQFVRPFLGDVLVVIWLYLLLRSLLTWPRRHIALFVLLFAYTVEVLQYFQLVVLLGWQDIRLARIIIGATFDYWDLLAYTLGVLLTFKADRA